MAGLEFPVEKPELGRPVEIVPGLFWVRLALPFALDHVHVWLGDEGDHWSVIDTGYGDAPTRATWETLLAGLLAGKPIGRVIVTHFHPDHVGHAGWLVAATGAGFAMSRTEWVTARWLSQDTSAEYVDGGERHARAMDLPEDTIQHQRRRGNAYRKGVTPPPTAFERLQAGSSLRFAGRDWTVVIGEGHAPEQVTLACPAERLLLAADQILPRISPNVSAWPSEPSGDPLGDYLRSLGHYADLPDETFVLPSHDRPFIGLHVRIAQIRAHHEERLERILEACEQPATGNEVMLALFDRPLDIHQTGFAISETLAHLNRLAVVGAVVETRDAAGVRRWRRT